MTKIDLLVGITLVVIGLLTGCSADLKAKWDTEDNSKCRSYGAAPGTPAYTQCRAQLDSARTGAIATYSTIK